MKKLSDFTEKEAENISDLLESKSNILGLNMWNNRNPLNISNKLGLCSTCKKLLYCRTEYNKIHAFCSIFEFKINGLDKIVECNRHEKRGVMDLDDMKEMAVIIDIEDQKIGF